MVPAVSHPITQNVIVNSWCIRLTRFSLLNSIGLSSLLSIKRLSDVWYQLFAFNLSHLINISIVRSPEVKLFIHSVSMSLYVIPCVKNSESMKQLWILVINDSCYSKSYRVTDKLSHAMVTRICST
jgi:hypothetical protein